MLWGACTGTETASARERTFEWRGASNFMKIPWRTPSVVLPWP